MIFKKDKQELIKNLNLFKYKHISNSFYYKKYLKIGSINKQRDIFLLLISKKDLEEANKNFISITYALKKLALYTIKTEDTNILSQLHLKHLDLKALKKRNLKMLFNYARIDSVYNGKDFKTLEFNARRPQMYEDTDWINTKIHKHINKIKKEENIKQIIKSIKNQFKSNNKNVKYLILISDFNKSGSFSFNKELKHQFNNTKVTRINFDKLSNFYRLLKLNKDGLYYKNKKIDAFVIQNLGKGKKSFFTSQGAINNLKIKEAYSKKQIEIASPLSCMFFGRKQSVKLLQQEYIQKLIKLSNKEIKAVETCAKDIPIDILYNTPNFENLVLKITGVGQGKGVFIGENITKKIVNEVKNYVKQNTTKVIVQEKINLEPLQIFMLKSKKLKKAVIQLEPFLIMQKNGKVKISGYSARAVLVKNTNSTTKFNPAFNNKKILFGSVIEYKE